jgi:hypothetical protein
MKFTMIRIYENDPKFVGDEVNIQLLDSDGIVILEGDYYHDKIDYQIDGFFACLDYLGIKYTSVMNKKDVRVIDC